ncbi:MAG: hypothetical protein P1P84_01555 [Deferrisomatales bacterium]|nr:hypothetical protein [Deferrisomatales bacterium]
MDRPAALPICGSARSARGLLLALLFCVPLLSGYVLPSAKVLQRWSRDGQRPTVGLPALVPVRLQGRDGQLYLDQNGNHALAVEGTRYAADAGPAALWRMLDLLLAPDEETAVAALEGAGVDLTRAGYARDDCSADGVAHTLGARGEGEAGLHQVWFGRSPLRPCRMRVGGDEVEVGLPGGDGWPAWFRLGGGVLLEVAGAPVPAPSRPSWAVPAVSPFAPDRSAPLGDWRRAFDPSRP